MEHSAADQMTTLRRVCLDKKTGSLLIMFGHRSASINLQDGEIVYIFYKAKKGEDALALLCSELAASPGTVQVRFGEGPIASVDAHLPTTEEILHRLVNSEPKPPLVEPAEATPPVAVAPSNAIAVSAAALPVNPGILLTDEIEAAVEETLVDYVGPVAISCCREAFKQSKTLRGAVDLLIDELPSADLAEQFLDSLRGAISASGQGGGYSFGLDQAAEQEATNSAERGLWLSEEVKGYVREILPEYFGPIAPVVADEVLDRVLSLRAAIDQLAARMPDAESAQRFKDDLRHRLNGSG